MSYMQSQKKRIWCMFILFSFPVLVAYQSTVAQAPTIDVKLVPIRSDGMYRIIDVGIPENPIAKQIIVTPGSRVWFELYYCNWAPELLEALQLTIDAQLFTNGVGEPIVPAFTTCTSDANCEGALEAGSECNLPGRPPNLYGLNTCRPGFITEGRDDGIPIENGGPFDLSNVRTATAYLSYGHVKISDAPKSDPGFEVYGGTLVMDVPAGASGIYTINLTGAKPDENSTKVFLENLVDTNVQSSPAFIEIGDFICCDGFECSSVITTACEITGGVNIGSCDTDCNNNGDPDICELTWFVRQDCNNNDQLDECDIDENPSLDCNLNGAIDACEIASGSSEDCDNNDWPDECDIRENPLLDCNQNGFMDDCDVSSGRSDDCNANNIPDDCEGLLTLGADCNGNGLLDSCDIADGFSFDNDGNCVPDECDPTIAPFAESEPLPKSRYISFIPTGAGCNTAVRVTLSDLPNFPTFQAQYHWLGPPQLYIESAGSTTLFTGAPLQCDPYFMDWSTVGLVHTYGAAIVPGSQYDIQLVDASCTDLSDLNCYTNSLSVRTGHWGDVIEPFFELGGGGPQQPNIADILAIVDKWLGSSEPSKPRAQLQPNTINPSMSVGISDILTGVDAWLGSSYPFAGPENCP